MKIGIFGLIALFVLSVSVPSSILLNQLHMQKDRDPIQVILDISYENHSRIICMMQELDPVRLSSSMWTAKAQDTNAAMEAIAAL